MNRKISNIATVLAIAVLAYTNAHAAAPYTKTIVDDKQPSAIAAAPVDVAKVADTSLSVLERFRTYAGPRTPASLSALFSTPPSAKQRQQPEVVLSNGATTVTIEVSLAAPSGSAPNVAFNGARMLSYERSPKGDLQIVALPDAGALKAELIVLTDLTTLEIPLVVAPPLPAETDLSEKGFISFLGGKVPAAQPLLDLNGDGRRDYVDDFIFAANYLVRQRSGASSTINRPTPVPDESGVNDNPESQKNDSPPPPESQKSSDVQSPLNNNGAASGPGAGFSMSPDSSSGVKPDTSPERHTPASRNERARKMMELLKRPSQ